MGGASEGSLVGIQRSSTEELFLRTIIEGSGAQANIGDVMGLFPSTSPAGNRTASEALFQSWLTSAEPQQPLPQQQQQQQQPQQPAQHDHFSQAPPVPASLQQQQHHHQPPRPRYLTRRISSELNAVIQQSHEMARNSSREDLPSQPGAVAEAGGREPSPASTSWQQLSGQQGLAGLGNGRLGPAGALSAGCEQKHSGGLARREEDRKAATLAAAANILTLLPNAPMTRSRSNELRRLVQSQGVALPSTDELLLQLAGQGELGAMLAHLQGLNAPPAGQQGGKPPPPPHLPPAPLPPLMGEVPGQLARQAGANSTSAAQGAAPRSGAPLLSSPGAGRASNVSAVVSLLKGNIERKKQQAAKQPPEREAGLGQWNICHNSGSSATAPSAHSARAQSPTGGSPGGGLPGGGEGQVAAPGEARLHMPPTRFGVETGDSAHSLSPGGHLSPSASALSPPAERSPTLSPSDVKGSPGGRAGLHRALPGGSTLDQHLAPPLQPSNHAATPSAKAGGGVSGGRLYGGGIQHSGGGGGGDSAAPVDVRLTGGSTVTGPRGAVGPTINGSGVPLSRSASITSSGNSGHSPGLAGNPSRHHRVERQRKMLEAKGRGGAREAPPPPPDVQQQQLKRRVEQLETENRSLKTFQSFMNRKDSEQTTRIEALEADNAALAAENERLGRELAHLQALCGGPKS